MQICDALQLQWHAVIPFFRTVSTDTDTPLERLLNLASQSSLFPTVQISHKFTFCFPSVSDTDNKSSSDLLDTCSIIMSEAVAGVKKHHVLVQHVE